MRIAFFTENSYKGGLDTFLINLFNAWPDENDELTFICNKSHPGLATIKNQTTRKVDFKLYWFFYTSPIALGQSSFNIARWKIVRAFFVFSHFLLQYIFLCPWYILNLSLFFRKSNYDKLMVVNGGYPASLLCRCAAIAWMFSGKKSKVIFNFHNYSSPTMWYNHYFENLIDKATYNASLFFISVTNNCLQSIKIRDVFKNGNKLCFIHNGIQDPNKENKIPNYKQENQYCLMLATYEPRKGHSYLLKAFKKVVENIPNINLKIYGFSGKIHEKQRVVDEVKSLGLEGNVELNDFANNRFELISNASVLVVPSLSEESFGLTIIEAMAFGIPVVATDIGGMPEVLDKSGAGLICSATNTQSMTDSLLRILQNPSLAESMGRNGRYTFEKKYNASLMAIEYWNKLKLT